MIRLKIRRSGYSLFEIIISLGVLAVVLVVVAQSVTLVARQRRVTQRRQLALQAAENSMERLFTLPWVELSTEKLMGEALPREFTSGLPGAALKIDVDEEAGPPSAKRLQVEVSWTDTGRMVGRPVRLTAWRYEP